MMFITHIFARTQRLRSRALVAALALLGVLGAKADEGSQAEGSAESVSGEALYLEHCAACHMPDGAGVPNFQPALRGSKIVSGDRIRLQIVVLAGSAALRDRENEFGTEMPPFGFLTNDEVQAILDYLKERFVPKEAEKS